MFGAYFDESGIDSESEVCLIAGFVADPDTMGNPAKKWNRRLDKYGVKVPFHAIQFYAPPEEIESSTTNPYKGWSQTKRKRFINELLLLLENRKIRMMASGVDSMSFKARTESERRYLTGGRWKIMNPNKWLTSGKPNSPYHYCFQVVIEGCADSLADGEQVHFFMSEQNQYEGFALQLYSEILNVNPPFPFRQKMDDSMTFASHYSYPQLQAADLVCYHLYQYALERRIDRNVPISPLHKRILGLAWKNSDLKFSSKETLDQLCARYRDRLLESDNTAMLRNTRLRAKVSHDLKECQILGIVDASGNYHPKAQDT